MRKLSIILLLTFAGCGGLSCLDTWDSGEAAWLCDQAEGIGGVRIRPVDASERELRYLGDGCWEYVKVVGAVRRTWVSCYTPAMRREMGGWHRRRIVRVRAPEARR